MTRSRSKRKKTRFNQLRRRITYSPFFIHCLASVAVFFIRIYNRTLKIKIAYHPDFNLAEKDKAFYGFWHGRQFLLVPNFTDWPMAIITDLSWAGEIQTRILSKLGYTVVRGSSKRKGVQALLNTKKAVEDGCAAAIALDGPRGPIYRSKPGILFLAQKMNYPIVPLAITAEHAWVFKNTWCRYMLPKPFSRCYIAMGKPVMSYSDGEELTSEKLDRIMIEWVEMGDRKMGREPEKIPA